jgi:cytochrome c
MIKKALVFAMGIMFLVGVSVAVAGEKGTAAEAQALVKKAVAYMKEVGKEKAFAEFNNLKGKFIYKDLYIYTTSMNGTNLSHPYTPALTGKDMYNLKDADGKLFVQAMVEIAKTKGKGSVEYRWTNQQTKKVEVKESYVEVVPGMDLFVTCGYYK